MDRLTLVILIMLGFAVIFGPLTARSAMRREPIYGGIISQLLHLIAAMGTVSLLPGLVTSLILGEGLHLLPVTLLTIALCLICFAIIELPARRAKMPSEPEYKGWTAEDAMKSGL